MFSRSIHRTLRSTNLPPVNRSLQHSLPRLRSGDVCNRLLFPRHYSTRPGDSFGDRVRLLFRSSPGAMTLATAGILFGMGTFVYIVYDHTYNKAPLNRMFPEPVAMKLRQGLWYMNVETSPQKALDNFQEAIRLAQQHGMHPFSKEVLGIKFRIVGLLEQFSEMTQAISVLDIIRRECQEFLDLKGNELNPAERMRMLAITARTSLKIGALYASPGLRNREASEENLMQGVNIILEEEGRWMEQEMSPEEEDEWIPRTELSTAFELAAIYYGVRHMPDYAAALYLKAYRNAPKDCHKAVLMNNLALSIAEIEPGDDIDVSMTPQERLEQAEEWVRESIVLAAAIKPPVRTEECDFSCVTATYNLGELAEALKKFEEAKRRYTEAERLARTFKHDEGVELAQEALRRLKDIQASPQKVESVEE